MAHGSTGKNPNRKLPPSFEKHVRRAGETTRKKQIQKDQTICPTLLEIFPFVVSLMFRAFFFEIPLMPLPQTTDAAH
jgi:hypothetical protein